MFCSNCGTKLSDEAKFCSNCGSKTANASEITEVVSPVEEKPPVIMREYKGIKFDAFMPFYTSNIYLNPQGIRERQALFTALKSAGLEGGFKFRFFIDKMISTDIELREAVQRWKAKNNDYSMDDDVRCPKCYSNKVEINKKGFRLGKSIVGLAVVGPVGLLAGAHGKNKLYAHCLKCKHEWKI